MLAEDSAYMQKKSFKPYSLLAMGVIRCAILDGDVEFFEDEERTSLWFGMAEFASALPLWKCKELAKEVRDSKVNDSSREFDIFSLVE